ncbi:MAG: AIPR family protein [Acidobacteria bacterium]|nr:AIPR family protein [Acidobacteriota bacterium]
MNNIILLGQLETFSSRYELTSLSTAKQFEKFVNYCLLKADHYDSFEFEKIETAECLGIDGLAIIVNGVIVNEEEEVKQLTRAYFEVKFYFTQAKTSSTFDFGDYLKFISTAKSFFGNDINQVPQELRNAFRLKEALYSKKDKMRELPVVELAYCYTGQYVVGNNDIIAIQMKQQVDSFNEMKNLFSRVTSPVYDANKMVEFYRAAQNAVQKQLVCQRHVALPPIAGATAAYLGVVKCEDYVALIQKENGELNKGIFFENVRDFLGAENSVNAKIAETIHSSAERDRFAILNNGVTIVARKVELKGDNFVIFQYQIVNGCQTSHVLFNNKGRLSSDMYVTVKLVETSDIDLSGRIIATTNSQSLVTKEALATTRPYHKNLEDFFSGMRNKGHAYYYERRPHQYDDLDDIKQSAIVSAPNLIKSFISVVMEQPHQVHYYYGQLLHEYNSNESTELFSESDYEGLYFASHHLVAKTRNFIRTTPELNRWIYHLAMLIKVQLAPNLKKNTLISEKNFSGFLQQVDQGFLNAIKEAVRVLNAERLGPDQVKSPEVTQRLINGINKRYRQIEKTPPSLANGSPLIELKLKDGFYRGTISHIDPQRGKVTIEYRGSKLDVKVTNANDIKKNFQVGVSVTFETKNGDVVGIQVTPSRFR